MTYQWGFVIAAYVSGIGPVAALAILSWLGMRKAEQRAAERNRGQR